jgi:hypothetical protein
VTRQTRGGQTLDSRVWALIEDAAHAVGVGYVVVQGSWSSSVGASAGTHAGGGAFDLRSRDYTRAQALAMVAELRKRNVCAWWRTPEFGWPATAGGPHIHGIVRDEPGLSPAAARQVADYDRGLNGLASHGRDPFPRPPQHPYQPGPTVPAPPPPEDDVTPAEAQAMIAAAVAPVAARCAALEGSLAAVRATASAALSTAAEARTTADGAMRAAEGACEAADLALYTAAKGATYADLEPSDWQEAHEYRDLPLLAAG